ncbi:hypothetical protein O1611_g987 [Lasiodiplodia mahajangana]|uniref:Uncharacterized protein n=1 Tax=Lasiodiplodia mahajangana TaxID=1108764 RepID=A0ACC2JYR2_9PEZI|nr:hypothetical protein O1611_g987 [Lasiodiplodia mahajangana]
MHFFQPPVPSLSPSLNLFGKTVIVTGATSGIGLEISRQLLSRRVSNLIMAVRNVSKGEMVRQALLSEPAIKAANSNAAIKVMELDTESFASVHRFASAFKAEFQDLHLLLANAGVGTVAKEIARSGHEKNIQVNYLSNVLLTLALLPALETTAEKTGEPARVTWTCSRMLEYSSLAKKLPLKQGEEVLKHFDTVDGLATLTRYADSKLLCVLFQLELAKHYNPDKVIINSFCPGHVDTSMGNDLPIYLRIPSNALKAIRGRPVHKAGWIALNAGLVAGPETHGQLLGDMIVEEPWEFIKSKEGERVRKMLWNETIDEMARLDVLPVWMTRLE